MKKDEKKLIHKAIDGEITKSETRRLHRKLETDGKARSEFEQLKQIVKETDRVRVDVPRDFRQKVLDQARKLSPPSSRP
jgi:anti-sigma factor RsiW